MTLDQKALEAAIRADQWPANLHAIVDAVNAASDDNDLSTEQCVALGIILVAHIPEPSRSPQPHTGRAGVTEDRVKAAIDAIAPVMGYAVQPEDYKVGSELDKIARAALNAALTVEPEAGAEHG